VADLGEVLHLAQDEHAQPHADARRRESERGEDQPGHGVGVSRSILRRCERARLAPVAGIAAQHSDGEDQADDCCGQARRHRNGTHPVRSEQRPEHERSARLGAARVCRNGTL